MTVFKLSFSLTRSLTLFHSNSFSSVCLKYLSFPKQAQREKAERMLLYLSGGGFIVSLMPFNEMMLLMSQDNFNFSLVSQSTFSSALKRLFLFVFGVRISDKGKLCEKDSDQNYTQLSFFLGVQCENSSTKRWKPSGLNVFQAGREAVTIIDHKNF